jgi:hypothetical protein
MFTIFTTLAGVMFAIPFIVLVGFIFIDKQRPVSTN